MVSCVHHRNLKVTETGKRDCKNWKIPVQFSCKEGDPLPISQRWTVKQAEGFGSLLFYILSCPLELCCTINPMTTRNRKQDPIGLFDSGLGGISVLHEVHKELPAEDLIYFGDSANNPYGTKDKDTIRDLSDDICRQLIQAGCKAIVIACNTATSAAAPFLRRKYDIPIIGMEPALKVAVDQHTNKRIAVWATDLTLKEKKFQDLMDKWGKDIPVTRVPCPQLVRLVEEDQLEETDIVDDVLRHYMDQSDNPDAVVLGCTHFVFYRKRLQQLFPEVTFIDGNQGTARHLGDVLADSLNDAGGRIEFRNSDPDKLTLSRKLYFRLED